MSDLTQLPLRGCMDEHERMLTRCESNKLGKCALVRTPSGLTSLYGELLALTDENAEPFQRT